MSSSFDSDSFPAPTVCPSRNPAVTLYVTGDEAVLHDTVRAQVYALNTSAYRIWQMCDGETTIYEMCQQLSSETNLATELLVPQIQEMLHDLYRIDVLDTGRLDIEGTAKPSFRKHKEVRIAFGGYHVSIHTDSQEIVDGVREIFGVMHTEIAYQSAGSLYAYDMGAGYTVHQTRSVHVQDGSLDEALRSLKHETVLRFIEARADLIWLHAGAVTNASGEAILLTGPWGSGKSTFVTHMLNQGWLYLSDDMVPIDPASNHIIPFPLTPARRYSQAQELDQEEIAQLPKHATRLSSDKIWEKEAFPVALLLPSYTPQVANVPQEISYATAAVSMIKHCQNMEHHGGQAIQTFCNLAGRITSYAIPYDDVVEAYNQTKRLITKALDPSK